MYLIGGTLVYKMPFWGMTKWPPIGYFLIIHPPTRFSLIYQSTDFHEILQTLFFQKNPNSSEIVVKLYRLSALQKLDHLTYM